MNGLGTAVVVDDNRSIRMLLGRLLQGEGYVAHPAANAAEALGLVGTLSHIDLLVTDLRMPDVDGVTLAREIEARFPDLSVLFISGEPDRAVDTVTAGHPRRAFLAKPFTTERFLAAIRALPGAGR